MEGFGPGMFAGFFLLAAAIFMVLLGEEYSCQEKYDVKDCVWLAEPVPVDLKETLKEFML